MTESEIKEAAEDELIIISNNVYDEKHEIFGKIIHLSVAKKDGSDNITWSELQELKNKIFGPDAQAFEVYPKQNNVVDYANVRHLWIISSDYSIPFSTKC